MARLRTLTPILATLLLAGCETAPPHVAAPKPLPMIVPPAPKPAPADWRDLPLSPGGWHYAQDAGGSSASFGTGFALRCTRATRSITLSRNGATGATLTVQTSYGRRILPAAGGVATLAASDPLLDQMAFSRGRFTIEATGVAMLVMPPWGEPARVIEDCRG